jgi:hypothetical protein
MLTVSPETATCAGTKKKVRESSATEVFRIAAGNTLTVPIEFS